MWQWRKEWRTKENKGKNRDAGTGDAAGTSWDEATSNSVKNQAHA